MKDKTSKLKEKLGKYTYFEIKITILTIIAIAVSMFVFISLGICNEKEQYISDMLSVIKGILGVGTIFGVVVNVVEKEYK